MANNKQKELIIQQLKMDESWESFVYELFNPKNPLVGEDFFEYAILKLSQFLNADYIFVACLDEDAEKLETVAFCHKEEILPGFSFSYQMTPCEEVLGDNNVTYSKGVQEAFTKDKRFKEMNINGYCGVPIYGFNRKPIGVLSALFCNDISDVKRAESLMFIFSSRIGSEILHMEKQKELKRRNLELLVFKEELIRKNRELDKINQELKKASLKVEESNKLKSAFLANLSHEVRTPMNAIIGFTELLRSNSLTDDEKGEYLNIIHQNGNQLMRVMDALIDISKLQTRVYLENKERIKVNSMITGIYGNYEQELTAMQKPIKLNLILGNEDGKDFLFTYKEALYKIFDHLIENAIKFTNEGNIYIGYTVSEGYFDFFVKDTGIGIPKGLEESIFDLFRQADLNNSREFGGNGIGLSIVRKYAEIMGGEVWAEPNQKQGALLKLKIPVKV